MLRTRGVFPELAAAGLDVLGRTLDPIQDLAPSEMTPRLQSSACGNHAESQSRSLYIVMVLE